MITIVYNIHGNFDLVRDLLLTKTWISRDRRRLFNAEGVYYKEVERLVHMDRMCSYRYLVYVESYGYSASLKYRLACGSVLFQGAISHLSFNEIVIAFVVNNPLKF